MLTLSNTFLEPERGQEEQRLERLLALSVEAFELGCRTPRRDVEHLCRELRAAGRCIRSLENYCPLPRELEPRGGVLSPSVNGDAIPFSSLDHEERRAAIAATRSTLEWAARCEARAVVVTCGRVPIPLGFDEFLEALAAGERERGLQGELRRRFLERRAEAAPAHLDAVRSTLDGVLRAAEHLEIPVALVNRRLPEEIPTTAELEQLLDEFRGAPMGCWYDTAHAHHQERLGFASATELHELMEPRLLGLHVHDLMGLECGLPPGEGELELRTLLAGVPEHLPLVLRCQGDDTRIARALEHLRDGGADPDDLSPLDPYLPIINR